MSSICHPHPFWCLSTLWCLFSPAKQAPNKNLVRPESKIASAKLRYLMLFKICLSLKQKIKFKELLSTFFFGEDKTPCGPKLRPVEVSRLWPLQLRVRHFRPFAVEGPPQRKHAVKRPCFGGRRHSGRSAQNLCQFKVAVAWRRDRLVSPEAH